MSATCRSCGAPIRWGVTEAGTAIPLDLDPVPDGNLVALGMKPSPRGAVMEVRVVKPPAPSLLDEGDEPFLRHYVSHFVTCPNAAEHRKRP